MDPLWEWKTQFFQSLSERMEALTNENVLFRKEDTGDWVMQTMLAATEELTDYVILQSLIYPARENVLLLEIYIRLFEETDPGAAGELQKAIQELNSFSPIGAFGIYPGGEHIFLRSCWLLDAQEDPSKAAERAMLQYDLMMEGVLAAYPGLKAMWEKSMTYRETVEANLLKKYSKAEL